MADQGGHGYNPPADSIASRTRSRTAAARAAAAAAAAAQAAAQEDEWANVQHHDPPAIPENAEQVQQQQQQQLQIDDAVGAVGNVPPPISDTDSNDSVATRMDRDARRGYPYGRGGGRGGGIA